jgi:hypothetical protein
MRYKSMYMSEKKVYLLMLAMVSILLMAAATGCAKDGCYSQKLYNQHKNDICTHDCPGVTGCDGKTYCNECEANKQGIAVVE